MSTLFFVGCIPTRLILAYIAYFLLNQEKNENENIKKLFILITMIIGIGFWTIYSMGWRKTGIETGGKKIWWNSLRPIHGTIYLLFTLLAYMGWKHSWILLLIDAIVGLIAELGHIYS